MKTTTIIARHYFEAVRYAFDYHCGEFRFANSLADVAGLSRTAPIVILPSARQLIDADAISQYLAQGDYSDIRRIST